MGQINNNKKSSVTAQVQQFFFHFVIIFGLYFTMLITTSQNLVGSLDSSRIVVGTVLFAFFFLFEIAGSLEPSDKASCFFWHLNPCFAHAWHGVTSCACCETCYVMPGRSCVAGRGVTIQISGLAFTDGKFHI